jgi:preprotein translocase subunit SecG
MWYTAVTVLHVIVCFFLATVVLLQQGKGSDVSAVFGGSSQTLFGSSGAGNLLTKLTSASAIIFMITSLTLTYGAARQNTKSLFDNTPVSTPAPAATLDNPPVAQSGTVTESQSAVTAEGQPPATATSPSTSASTATPSTPAAPQQSGSAAPTSPETK